MKKVAYILIKKFTELNKNQPKINLNPLQIQPQNLKINPPTPHQK